MERTWTGLAFSALAVLIGLLAAGSAQALTPALPRVTVVVGDVRGQPAAFDDDPMRTDWAPPLFRAPGLPVHARIELSKEPASVQARLVGPDGQPLPYAVATAPVEPSVWLVAFAEPVPDLTRVVLDVSWPDFKSVPFRYVFAVHGVAPTPIRQHPAPGPVTVPSPVPGPVAVDAPPARPAPQASVVGLSRRGDRVILRVRTNVAGRLRIGVRQGRGVQTWEHGGLRAGTHRVAVTLPRPDRDGVALTLRLTDTRGASARATARIG